MVIGNGFIFRQLGDEWTVTQSLEQFTCVMYGHPRETSVNTVRANMLRKMVGDDEKLTTKSKVDLAHLPPCQDSLIPHIQRVNYRVACYKRAHQPTYQRPKPYDVGYGWEKSPSGLVEPLWSCGLILPASLTDVLERLDIDEEVEALHDDDEADAPLDYDDMLQYLDDDEIDNGQ